MPTTITKRLEWDAAHRVLRHESKCRSTHGHRYAAELTCSAEKLDALNRVIDFGVVKEKVGTWIDDHWDHTTLVNVEDKELFDFCEQQARDHGNRKPYLFGGEPTAEMIAETLFEIANKLLQDTGVAVTQVDVYETPTSKATHTGPK